MDVKYPRVKLFLIPAIALLGQLAASDVFDPGARAVMGAFAASMAALLAYLMKTPGGE
jgi:hypothetical protein